ncbi:neuromodulin [Antennarius striatus]|uniref:neuromodulin n=1 Tax=Antennarius striatus TaxID=241820 RepID=UPI0035B34EBE
MLCCIRRTKPVEKSEEAEQKLDQDGSAHKPEDTAHKAATKIQASFRGHITRKKMKDGEEEKEADGPAPDGPTEGGDDVKKETEPERDDAGRGNEAQKEEESGDAKSPAADKPANSPAGAATSPVAVATSPVAAAAATSPASAPLEPKEAEPKAEEKPEEKPKEEVTAVKSPTAEEEGAEPEEARQADVPEGEEPNQTNEQPDAAEEDAAPAEAPAPADESKDD